MSPNPADRQAIRVLTQGDEQALEVFLLDRLESSMFLLGNLRDAGLVDRDERLQGTYAASLDSGRITGVVAHYWNQNLVLQAPTGVGRLCRTAAEAAGRPVKGLIGPSDQVAEAAASLGIVSSSFQLDQVEKLYRLELSELIVPALVASGRAEARRAEAGDTDLLALWRARYAVEALHEPDTAELRQRSRADVERYCEQGRLWVLEHGGETVAVSGFNTATREAVQVGGVWTPPESRGRGYARAVVAASLVDARTEGASLGILFTGYDNVAAQRAYEALGFDQVGDYRLLLLASGRSIRH